MDLKTSGAAPHREDRDDRGGVALRTVVVVGVVVVGIVMSGVALASSGGSDSPSDPTTTLGPPPTAPPPAQTVVVTSSVASVTSALTPAPTAAPTASPSVTTQAETGDGDDSEPTATVDGSAPVGDVGSAVSIVNTPNDDPPLTIGTVPVSVLTP